MTASVPSYIGSVAQTAHRSLGLVDAVGSGRRKSRGHQKPPAPQRGPSTRFGRSLTTHETSTTGSLAAPIPSLLAGMTRLVVAGRPYLVETAPGLTPEPQAQPVSSSNRSLREPAADTSFREYHPPRGARSTSLTMSNKPNSPGVSILVR